MTPVGALLRRSSLLASTPAHTAHPTGGPVRQPRQPLDQVALVGQSGHRSWRMASRPSSGPPRRRAGRVRLVGGGDAQGIRLRPRQHESCQSCGRTHGAGRVFVSHRVSPVCSGHRACRFVARRVLAAGGCIWSPLRAPARGELLGPRGSAVRRVQASMTGACRRSTIVGCRARQDASRTRPCGLDTGRSPPCLRERGHLRWIGLGNLAVGVGPLGAASASRRHSSRSLDT